MRGVGPDSDSTHLCLMHCHHAGKTCDSTSAGSCHVAVSKAHLLGRVTLQKGASSNSRCCILKRQAGTRGETLRGLLNDLLPAQWGLPHILNILSPFAVHCCVVSYSICKLQVGKTSSHTCLLVADAVHSLWAHSDSYLPQGGP